MTPINALSFDLDGTLLNGSLFLTSIERTCQQLASAEPSLDADRLLSANGEVWAAYWPEIEGDWTLGVVDGASVTLETWRRTLKACGYEDDSLAQLAQQTHLQFGRQTFRLFDDVEGLFSLLKTTGIPLALVTNGAPDTQREKLKVLGIEPWFDAILISGELGIAKPDPPIFTLAVDRLGVGPEGFWHVGDSLLTDVAGAKAAGLSAVWLNRHKHALPNQNLQPDLEIHSLSHLTNLIAA